MIPWLIMHGIDVNAILLLLFIFFGVPIIGTIIALSLIRKKPKTAKIIGVITTVYALIGFGFCSGMF